MSRNAAHHTQQACYRDFKFQTPEQHTARLSLRARQMSLAAAVLGRSTWHHRRCGIVSRCEPQSCLRGPERVAAPCPLTMMAGRECHWLASQPFYVRSAGHLVSIRSFEADGSYLPLMVSVERSQTSC
jgi:hypothetical protein